MLPDQIYCHGDWSPLKQLLDIQIWEVFHPVLLWLVLDELLHGVDALQVIVFNIKDMIKIDTERANEAEDDEVYDILVNIIM